LPWDMRVEVEERTFAETLLWKLSGISLQNLVFYVFQPRVAGRLQHAKRSGRIHNPVVVTNGFTHHPENLRGFDYVHVLAPYYLELANRLGIETGRWYFVPQPVDTRVFRPHPRDEARRRLGFKEDDFVVLVVGAISRYKRIEHAIREVASLKPRCPSAKLLIVGQPERETPEIIRFGKKMLGGDVMFATARYEDMPEIYPAGDVFALPTRKEITGNVFTEAMASGVPAIGDDFPVTRWIIGDGGDTVDMRQGGELAEVLEKYANDDSYRSKRSRLARERALEHFSLDAVAPLYLKMFESIAEEAGFRAIA